MSRRTAVVILSVVALAILAAPALATTPLNRIKKLERRVQALAVLIVLHDNVSTTTATGAISWNQNYGTGSATCPFGTLTSGGLQWTGPAVGIDTAIIASYPIGNTWFISVRAGAGTTATAQVVVVCASLN